MPTTGTRFIYVILDKVEEILDDSFYQEMLEISPEFMKKFQHDFKVSPTALLYPRCIIIVEQTPKTVTKLNGHLLNILQFFFFNSILEILPAALPNIFVIEANKWATRIHEIRSNLLLCFQKFDYGTPTFHDCTRSCWK